MDAFLEAAESVCKRLGVMPERGLSAKDAALSRERLGANVLTRAKKKNPLVRLANALTEPMMLILLLAFGITATVNSIRAFFGEPFDWAEIVGIFIAIVLSVTITLLIERRGERAFEALSKMSGNAVCTVLRDGVWTKIAACDLVTGDILRLSTGDKIPADARLFKTDEFETDESPLTGESLPVSKDASAMFRQGAVPPLAERTNMVYSGCFVTEGQALAIVTAVGDQTELGAIAGALGNTYPEETPLQQKLSRLGKMVAFFGIAAAAIVFVAQIVQMFVSKTVSLHAGQDAFITSIVLIVAAVPEGLPTIVAVSLALNVVKMAKENALVKKPAACETVGSVGIICSDKTGTLTQNKMTVEEVRSGNGSGSRGAITDMHMMQNICINSTAEVMFDSKYRRYNYVGNPTECALLAAYEGTKQKQSYAQIRAGANMVHVYPFSSEHKRMTSVLRGAGEALTVLCKGAPELILGLCEMSSHKRSEILAEIASYQRQAKRVVAFAHGGTQPCDFARERDKVERNLIFDGYAVLSDPIRPEVYDAVKACKKAGIGIKILTGDHAVTATAIARELGLVEGVRGVFEAHEIDAMSDGELRRRLNEILVVARSSPATKLRVVKAIKDEGGIVAVTGDGINDAPAIKAADVGIAMGVAGAEVCKEASDIVLADDSFSTIVNSIRWGRGIFENFRRFILFQLTVNISAVLVTVVCILSGIGSPFNALQLLWINMIMDGPPALTLGLEPIDRNVMNKKPIARGEHIVTRTMAARILINGIFIGATLLLQAFTNFLQVPVQKEKTVLFTLFITFQLFNAFNARELGRESIVRTFSRNKLMLVVMAVTFLLQIVIVQFASDVFATVPLTLVEWLKVLATGVSVIIFNEIYKAVYKKADMKKRNSYRSYPSVTKKNQAGS